MEFVSMEGGGAHTLRPCYLSPPIRLRFGFLSPAKFQCGCNEQRGRSFFTTHLIHKTRADFNTIGHKPYPVPRTVPHIRRVIVPEPAALIRIVCFVTRSLIRNRRRFLEEEDGVRESAEWKGRCYICGVISAARYLV